MTTKITNADEASEMMTGYAAIIAKVELFPPTSDERFPIDEPKNKYGLTFHDKWEAESSFNELTERLADDIYYVSGDLLDNAYEMVEDGTFDLDIIA